MKFRFRLSSGVRVLLFMAASTPSALVGRTSPIIRDPISDEARMLLLSLEKDAVTGPELTDILARAQRNPVGMVSDVVPIIQVALADGALSRDVVNRSVEHLGCTVPPKGDTNLCALLYRAGHDATPGTPRVVHDGKRLETAGAGLDGLSGSDPQWEARTRGYFDELGRGPGGVVNLARIIGSRSSDEVPPAVRPAIRSVASAANGSGKEMFGLAKGAAWEALIRLVDQSKGGDAVVAEVRRLSADDLRALQADAETDSVRVDTTATICIIAGWTRDTGPPGRWKAWRQLLECRGGW